jgi:hypothetical protein
LKLGYFDVSDRYLFLSLLAAVPLAPGSRPGGTGGPAYIAGAVLAIICFETAPTLAEATYETDWRLRLERRGRKGVWQRRCADAAKRIAP